MSLSKRFLLYVVALCGVVCLGASGAPPKVGDWIIRRDGFFSKPYAGQVLEVRKDDSVVVLPADGRKIETLSSDWYLPAVDFFPGVKRGGRIITREGSYSPQLHTVEHVSVDGRVAYLDGSTWKVLRSRDYIPVVKALGGIKAGDEIIARKNGRLPADIYVVEAVGGDGTLMIQRMASWFTLIDRKHYSRIVPERRGFEEGDSAVGRGLDPTYEYKVAAVGEDGTVALRTKFGEVKVLSRGEYYHKPSCGAGALGRSLASEP